MRRAIEIYEDLVRRDLLELARACGEAHGVGVQELLSSSHARGPAHARHAFWHALRHHPECEWSYPAIGRLFGCCHTTILMGERAHERRLATTEAA